MVDPVGHEPQSIQQVLVPRSQWFEAGIALRLPHRRHGLVEHAADVVREKVKMLCQKQWDDKLVIVVVDASPTFS